jgi:hypothetical protein
VADTVRVGLDRRVLDALGSEALEQRVEPSDGEGNPARARPQGVRLDEEPGTLVDLPENLVPDATVWGSPEEPRVPIDADVEIEYRNTGERCVIAPSEGGDIPPALGQSYRYDYRAARNSSLDQPRRRSAAGNAGSLFHHVRGTMLVTVFVFLGVEGASIYSRHAKRGEDVGRATVLGFLSVFAVFALVTTSGAFGARSSPNSVSGRRPNSSSAVATSLLERACGRAVSSAGRTTSRGAGEGRGGEIVAGQKVRGFHASAVGWVEPARRRRPG